jgi:hypothetical protein
MTIKQCSKCKEHKTLSDFYKHKKNKDKLSYHCKSCISYTRKVYNNENKVKISINNKKYRQENELIQGYALYYLPEEHYIGFTNNLKSRLRSHRGRGRITEGYEVIGVYKCPIYTHLLETRLHLIGYNGFQHKY